MDTNRLREHASKWLAGELSFDVFLDAFREAAITAWSGVSLDTDRAARCGFPEVVFGEGKRLEDLVAVAARCRANGTPTLMTRLSEEALGELAERFPDGAPNSIARTWRWPSDCGVAAGRVVVLTAGTTDRPVAEEAIETLQWMKVDCELIQDIGVAGPHRLLAHVSRLQDADAVVVVAGMEGALPSVVGGHVPCPVVAVPTSVGYGAACGGLAALLGMLNSCAANVTVVNIDAGFKGGYIAGLIASRAHRSSSTEAGSSAGGARAREVDVSD